MNKSKIIANLGIILSVSAAILAVTISFVYLGFDSDDVSVSMLAVGGSVVAILIAFRLGTLKLP